MSSFNHNISDILIVTQYNSRLHELEEALRDKPNMAYKGNILIRRRSLGSSHHLPPRGVGRLRDEPKEPIRKLHLRYPPTSSFTWVNKSPGLRPDSNAALP